MKTQKKVSNIAEKVISFKRQEKGRGLKILTLKQWFKDYQ